MGTLGLTQAAKSFHSLALCASPVDVPNLLAPPCVWLRHLTSGCLLLPAARCVALSQVLRLTLTSLTSTSAAGGTGW
jgi:hypothetical protein